MQGIRSRITSQAFLLASVTDAEVAETDTSFWLWWLRAFGQIMAFFVTIVIDDLAEVAAIGAVFLLFTIVNVGGIDPSGRYGAFSGTTISFILAIVLLLLFSSLLGGLSVIGALTSWGLRFLRSGLRFFDPWVLHQLALGTSFGCWQPTTPEAVLIGLASIEAGPESGLGLCVNGFFD